MEVKIKRLKLTCDGLFGYDINKKLYIYKNGKWEKENDFEWEYDFEVCDGFYYFVRNRRIFKKKKDELSEDEIIRDLLFPARIKFRNDSFYILDKERGTIIVFDRDFSVTESYFTSSPEIFEKKGEIFLDMPFDFDVYEKYIGILDIGNRRTVVYDLKKDESYIFRLIGEKIRFLNDKKFLVLYDDELFSVDIKSGIMSKAKKRIIDFEVFGNEVFILD